MPRSQTTRHDGAAHRPPRSGTSSARTVARRYLIDLIPFLLMAATVAYIIVDNARG